MTSLTDQEIIEAGKPRFLSEAEIDYIIDVIPEPLVVGSENAKAVHDSIKDYIKNEIILYKISPYAISNFREKLLNAYNMALQIPGKAIGMVAANSIGQPLMQLVLNAFHTSGAARNVAAGYESVKNILSGTERIADQSTSIFFTTHTNFEEALRFREKYVEVMVGEIIIPEQDDLDTPANIIGDSIPWWYSVYQSLYNVDVNSVVNEYLMLRLPLDVIKMSKYNITPEEVCDVVQKYNSKRNMIITCIVSPFIKTKSNDGIVTTRCYLDIFPNSQMIIQSYKINASSNTEIVRFSLQKIVFQNLNNIKIKGINNIKDIFPVRLTIWSIVDKIFKNDDLWLIKYNEHIILEKGIKPKQLIKLCEFMGMTVIPSDKYHTDKYLLLKPGQKPYNFDEIMKIDPNNATDNLSPKDFYNYYNKNYTAIIESEAAKQRRADLKKYMKNNLESYSTNEETTTFNDEEIAMFKEFGKLYILYYIDTSGNNLREIFKLPGVDPYHTFSNDIHEINASLGIEAVRNYIIKILTETITNNSEYVHPNIIIFIADFMTHLGELTKFTFSGSNNLGGGPFHRGTFQRATQVERDAASTGVREDTRNIAMQTLLGQVGNYGSNYQDNGELSEHKLEFYKKYGHVSLVDEDIDEIDISDVVSDLNEYNAGDDDDYAYNRVVHVPETIDGVDDMDNDNGFVSLADRAVENADYLQSLTDLQSGTNMSKFTITKAAQGLPSLPGLSGIPGIPGLTNITSPNVFPQATASNVLLAAGVQAMDNSRQVPTGPSIVHTTTSQPIITTNTLPVQPLQVDPNMLSKMFAGIGQQKEPGLFGK